MTINKSKKNVRQRGTKTHGWGAKKKHRGAGNRGGRGKAGTGKRADQKKPSIWKIKKYFGKHGFKNLNSKIIKTINLQYLENHIVTLVKDKVAIEQNGAYTIDLAKMGYDKLLSKGILSRKFNITVAKATEKAIGKVEKAGGSVTILTVKSKLITKSATKTDKTDTKTDKTDTKIDTTTKINKTEIKTKPKVSKE